MTFRRRQIRVQIQLVGDTFDGGANSLELAGVRCRATVQGTVGGATPFQSQAHLRLEGMLPNDMAKLSTLGLSAGLYTKNAITIFAGDDVAGLSQVFTGSIYNAFVDYNAIPDVAVEITASATAQLQRAPIAASSYKGPMSVASMLQGIAANAGLGFTNAGVTTVLANHAVAGSAANQIADICQAAGINYDVQNRVLTIWPATGTRDAQVIAVSSATGLLGYPSYNAQGIDVQLEFNPNVFLGRRLSVTSDVPNPTGAAAQLLNPSGVQATGANGTFYVFDVQHDLSAETPGGPWFTYASLSSINTQARPA